MFCGVKSMPVIRNIRTGSWTKIWFLLEVSDLKDYEVSKYVFTFSLASVVAEFLSFCDFSIKSIKIDHLPILPPASWNWYLGPMLYNKLQSKITMQSKIFYSEG